MLVLRHENAQGLSALQRSTEMQAVDSQLRFHEHAVSKAFALLSRATPCLGITVARSGGHRAA
jgi:hypothetical protein